MYAGYLQYTDNDPKNQSERLMWQASPYCRNFIPATQNGTQ